MTMVVRSLYGDLSKRGEFSEQELKKLAAMEHNATMAIELMDSPAWPWFVEQLEVRARQLEAGIMSDDSPLEQREFDTARGKANGIRWARDIVTVRVEKYRAAQEKVREQTQETQYDE